MPATINQPYYGKENTTIYDLLFCDKPELYSGTIKEKEDYPWTALSAENPASSDLQGIANDTSLETRVRLVAYNRLRKNGYAPPVKELLGVVVEVGLDSGLDTLAAYKNGTARYLNFTGKMIFWDSPMAESNAIIEQLFAASQKVVEQIGPWDSERLTPPPAGSVRLTFLVSDGLYFGEGPFTVLQKDPMAAPVIVAATRLLTFLTERG